LLCRPFNPKALLEQVRGVVNDPNVTVEPTIDEFRQANYSPTEIKRLNLKDREGSAKY
jgi:hypothetical protein